MPLKDCDFENAVKLGETLVDAIKGGESYPDQLYNIAERKDYFGQLITRRRDEWPYEYEYWREKGWL